MSSTNPELVSVRLIDVGEPEKPMKNDINGAVSARMEIVVHARKPGALNETIQVFPGEGRPPDLVPVVGRIVAPFEMSPSIVVLPRQSEAGLLYQDVSFCKSVSDKPSRVVLESVPPDLKAQVLGDKETAEGWPIRISIDPARSLSDNGPVERVVRLRAANSETEAVLELRVILHK